MARVGGGGIGPNPSKFLSPSYVFLDGATVYQVLVARVCRFEHRPIRFSVYVVHNHKKLKLLCRSFRWFGSVQFCQAGVINIIHDDHHVTSLASLVECV